MTDTLVKICGLREPATLDAALDAGADMVGFVFFAPSPRNLSLDAARTLAARVDGRARIVALTVDADDAALAAVVAAVAPDMLQLHGGETPERVGAVRARFGVPVMRALAIAGPDDLRRAARFEGACDALLFDARPPAGADRPGGHGGSFDWTLLKDHAPQRPWLLAGGLRPGNVGAAMRASGAHGVDVSSGVEASPGVKDADLIARFVAAARGAAVVA